MANFHVLAVMILGMVVTHALAAPNEVKVTELAPGVFFRKAQTLPTFTGCNQGWVIFKDYVLLIDANFPGQADEVIQTIRKHTDKPIRFVFDTHYHGDHADGNPQYVKIGATIIAHERSQLLFQTKGLDGFRGAQQDEARKGEYGPLTYAIPSLFFSHKLIFDDGAQRVELLFLGHAHTAGDAVAWVPQHGILFTGDACVNGAFNYTGDSDTESWISVLGAMSDLGVKHVAPGHGELGGPEVLDKQRNYFVSLREAIGTAVAAGRTLEQIKQEISIPSYKEWTGVEVTTRGENIEHVHRELTGAKRPIGEHRPFQEWQGKFASESYRPAEIWQTVGSHASDTHWSSLADIYLNVDSARRRQIRDHFSNNSRDLNNMRQFVRRMGKRVESVDDVDWVRRGLVTAAIEGGRVNYQDTIVSLVLLRHGAERVGIDSDRLFREVQQPEYVAPENKPLFEIARTLPADDVRELVQKFGPTEWAQP